MRGINFCLSINQRVLRSKRLSRNFIQGFHLKKSYTLLLLARQVALGKVELVIILGFSRVQLGGILITIIMRIIIIIIIIFESRITILFNSQKNCYNELRRQPFKFVAIYTAWFHVLVIFVSFL